MWACHETTVISDVKHTQFPLANVVMETLRNHTQQKWLSYSKEVQTVTLLMCIRQLYGTNVPRETDGHLQSIETNIVIRSKTYFFPHSFQYIIHPFDAIQFISSIKIRRHSTCSVGFTMSESAKVSVQNTSSIGGHFDAFLLQYSRVFSSGARGLNK